MPAVDSALLDLVNCMDGYVETGRRLMQHFGIDIRYASLGSDIGHYDGQRRTVIVNGAAPLQDQLWFLIQVWQLCSIGPAAVPDAQAYRPVLRLVEP